MRGRLDQLLTKMEGNDKLDQLLSEVLENSENAKELAGQLGISGLSAQRKKNGPQDGGSGTGSEQSTPIRATRQRNQLSRVGDQFMSNPELLNEGGAAAVPRKPAYWTDSR